VAKVFDEGPNDWELLTAAVGEQSGARDEGRSLVTADAKQRHDFRSEGSAWFIARVEEEPINDGPALEWMIDKVHLTNLRALPLP